MNRYTEYDPLAWLYDRHWGSDAVRRFLPIIEKLVLANLPPEACILDLCCGTGQLAQALSERGYQVTGIDASAEMIHHAKSNAPKASFIVEDARNFHLPPIYHAVLSTYDSLNHIPSLEELTQVFSSVTACLQSEGVFLFDMNMEEGYRARWRGSWGMVRESYAFIVHAVFDESEKLAKFITTVFRPAGELWHRSDFTLSQRCYAEDEIKSALEAAGFAEIQVYDAQRDFGLSGEVGRAFFLARKRG